MAEDSTNPSSNKTFLNSSHDSIDDFVKDVMVSVRDCQKVSTELQGWHHFRDFSAMQSTMDQVNTQLTSLITSIFAHSDVKLKLAENKLVDKFEMIREGNDALLERINSVIDDAAGLKKQPALEFIDASIRTVKKPVDKNGQQMVLIAAKNTQKPQLFFSEKINNSKKEPFIPLLKEKPNSMKPLSILLSIDGDGREFIDHPYKYELEHWTPLPNQLENGDVSQPRDMDETPLIRINTPDELEAMINKLKECSEFAVDLEHHFFRSYQGLTCLMQISTRTDDYIIDTIALRGKMTALNDVFSNPKIIKVIHGADYDILWLQRDCGVYVVNMFDTHQAAVVLEYPHRSLAALLHHFCNIQANKVYQRADWRTRPLPIDFLDYARQDTHYLLYIFDMIRNELIQKGNQLNNLITAVYSRSNEICLKRYEKPFVDEESYLNLYRRCRKTFNNRSVICLQKLFLWRDSVAREHDESVDFVLPKHMMLQISEVLPKEMQGILACCNPIPALVKSELLTLHTMIRSAREQPLSKIDSMPKPIYDIINETIEDLAMATLSKHDLSQMEEDISGLPCLLDGNDPLSHMLSNTEPIKMKVRNTLFGCHKNKIKCKMSTRMDSVKTKEFMSPYQRYLSFLELKPLLEGDKKRKLESNDDARLNRVKDHLKLVLEGIPADQKATTDENADNSSTPKNSSESTQINSEFDSDKTERIQGLFNFLNNLQKPDDIESFTPNNAKSTSNQNSLPTSDNDITDPDGALDLIQDSAELEKKEKKKEKAKAKRKLKAAPLVLNNEIKKKKKKKKKNLQTTTSQIEVENIDTVSDTIKKKKKKKIEDDSLKTNLTILENANSDFNCILDSEDDDTLPVPKKKKMKKDNAIENKCTNSSPVNKRKSTETADDQCSKKIKSSEESMEDSITEEGIAFDYSEADFSVFENKSKKKANKNKKFQEKFKGTNQRSKGVKKSGMKCFTWGGGGANKRK